MKYVDRETPEGFGYKHAVPEGQKDLPNLTPSEAEQLKLMIKDLAANGKLIRGMDVVGDQYCVVGAASFLDMDRGNWTPLVEINNQDNGGCMNNEAVAGKPVNPEQVPKIARMIDRCVQWFPVDMENDL